MRAGLLFLLAAFALAGCAHTKSAAQPPKPPAPTNPYLAPPPKPAKPFFLFSWLNKVTGLIPHKAKPPIATTPQWLGSIRMVNTAENFVLIESSTMSSAVPGETYLSVGNGAETASLRMTSLKNPPFLIADIISGNPSPGEKIYLPKTSAQPAETPAPKPAPAPKKSKALPIPGSASTKTAPQTVH